ncbi:MAG: hypothetical protein AB7L66_08365 [Gemmatimonadales bacterium]
MNQRIVLGPRDLAGASHSRWAGPVEAATWALLAGLAGVATVLSARNVPLGPEWSLFGPDRRFLAEQGPVSALWLEVGARLNYDLRILSLFSVVALAGAALILERAARRLRGHPSLADVAIPLVVLNPGLTASLAFGWQAGTVLAVALAAVVLAGLLADPELDRPKAALTAIAALVVLAGTTAPGPGLALMLGPWVVRGGIRVRRRRHRSASVVGAAAVAGGAAAAGIGVWQLLVRLAAGPAAGLRRTMEILATGFGPGAAGWLGVAGAVLLAAAAGLVALGSMRNQEGLRRRRAEVMVVFLLGALLGALMAGWAGVGALGPGRGFEDPWRFAAVALPLGWVCYLSLLLSPGPDRRPVAAAVALAAVLLLVPNARDGARWRTAFDRAAGETERELLGGPTIAALAAGLGDLIGTGWQTADLAAAMDSLRKHGARPFGNAAGSGRSELSPVVWPEGDTGRTKAIRYRARGAGAVTLVWGIDGWRPLPPERRPAGTEIQNRVMLTPMQPEGDGFVVTVPVPQRGVVQYGFLTERGRGDTPFVPVWHGDFELRATAAGATNEATPAIERQIAAGAPEADPGVRQAFRYYVPAADSVRLRVQAFGGRMELPPGAARDGDGVLVPMTRIDDKFEATIAVPVGETAYGYQVFAPDGARWDTAASYRFEAGAGAALVRLSRIESGVRPVGWWAGGGLLLLAGALAMLGVVRLSPA